MGIILRGFAGQCKMNNQQKEAVIFPKNGCFSPPKPFICLRIKDSRELAGKNGGRLSACQRQPFW
jgi:hypothetical protein